MMFIITMTFPISWLNIKKYDGEIEIPHMKSIFMQEERTSLCASQHKAMS